jgi:hypothetical protein
VSGAIMPRTSVEVVAATIAGAAMTPAHAIALGVLFMMSAGPARALVRFRRWLAAAFAAHAPIVAMGARGTPASLAIVVAVVAVPVAVYCWARAVHVARGAGGRDTFGVRARPPRGTPVRAPPAFAGALGLAAICFVLVAALLATAAALHTESLPLPFLPA